MTSVLVNIIIFTAMAVALVYLFFTVPLVAVSVAVLTVIGLVENFRTKTLK
jgi:hypothetical protein